MKNHEITPKTSKISKVTIVGALAVGSLLSTGPEAGASMASGTSPRHNSEAPADMLGNKEINQAIVNQESIISRKIGQQLPVQFENKIAYYHGPGKEHFYVENFLTVTVQVGKNHKKVNLIGYIERKGSGAGPDVVMFENNPSIVKIVENPADPKNLKKFNPVIFPSKNGSAFDTSNPVNPKNLSPYTDLANNPSFIGMFYTAKK